MAEPATAGALNEQQVLLSTLPPSRGQKRLALATVLVLLAAFCATVPFAAVPVGYIGEFIPAYATAMFVISSITSALLFVQFSVVHSRALLAVSGGYLFSALITIPWALTFPDLFGATDTAGTTWGVLTRIWRLVFPLSVIGYTLLKDDEGRTTVRARSVAHGRDVRLADRALPDHFGRSPLRCRMVCRTRLLPRFLDARVGRPAFRNRFALCATRPFRDGAKARTRSAADDDGRVVGVDRARDESTAGQYRHERRCGFALDGAPDTGSRRSESDARADSQFGLSCQRPHRQHPGDGQEG